jgi:excisionase family DNA binding protein
MAIGGSNRLVSCRELAEFLSVPERTVRDNWRKWNLQAHKVGRAIRFRERDVDAWLQRNTLD